MSSRSRASQPIATHHSAAKALWLRGGAAAGIVAAGLFAYHGVLHSPFIFDDMLSIVENLSIRHLLPLREVLLTPPGSAAVSGRPLVNLSLALNYAVGGLDVRGYHAANIAIHVLAGLTLFGIVRRTLLRHRPDGATAFAFVAALLWTVHPLLTESVTCVIQRTESLMGLFYLLTLYFFVRAFGATSAEVPVERTKEPGKVSGLPSFVPQGGTTAGEKAVGVWGGLSVLCCFFGMATKEVMVSAPLIVLLYDRTFVAGSFAAAWRLRGRYYVALAATWLMLGFLLIRQHGSRGEAAGFGLGMSVATYALTQCWAIVHYLGLALWPRPLVVDFGSDTIRHVPDVALQALMLLALLVGTGVALFGPIKSRWVGFLGAWFFLILAPSSSILPLPAQTVAEHRMYLPLAAVLVALLAGLRALMGRRVLWLGVAWAPVLIGMTLERNQDYRSGLAIWADTVAKRPGNSRAQDNLGLAWAGAGRWTEAEACYREALRIDPAFEDAHRNFGDSLFARRDFAGAVAHYREAVRLKPSRPETHQNLGSALFSLGHVSEAVSEFREALRLRPDFPEAERNLGNALRQSGDLSGAIAHFTAGARLRPDDAEAENGLGYALRDAGRQEEAITHYRNALRLRPDFAEAHNNLGAALGNQGRFAEAIPHFEAAVRIRPDYLEARRNLELARVALASGRRR